MECPGQPGAQCATGRGAGQPRFRRTRCPRPKVDGAATAKERRDRRGTSVAANNPTPALHFHSDVFSASPTARRFCICPSVPRLSWLSRPSTRCRIPVRSRRISFYRRPRHASAHRTCASTHPSYGRDCLARARARCWQCISGGKRVSWAASQAGGSWCARYQGRQSRRRRLRKGTHMRASNSRKI